MMPYLSEKQIEAQIKIAREQCTLPLVNNVHDRLTSAKTATTVEEEYALAQHTWGWTLPFWDVDDITRLDEGTAPTAERPNPVTLGLQAEKILAFENCQQTIADLMSHDPLRERQALERIEGLSNEQYLFLLCQLNALAPAGWAPSRTNEHALSPGTKGLHDASRLFVLPMPIAQTLWDEVISRRMVRSFDVCTVHVVDTFRVHLGRKGGLRLDQVMGYSEEVTRLGYASNLGIRVSLVEEGSFNPTVSSEQECYRAQNRGRLSLYKVPGAPLEVSVPELETLEQTLRPSLLRGVTDEARFVGEETPFTSEDYGTRIELKAWELLYRSLAMVKQYQGFGRNKAALDIADGHPTFQSEIHTQIARLAAFETDTSYATGRLVYSATAPTLEACQATGESQYIRVARQRPTSLQKLHPARLLIPNLSLNKEDYQLVALSDNTKWSQAVAQLKTGKGFVLMNDGRVFYVATGADNLQVHDEKIKQMLQTLQDKDRPVDLTDEQHALIHGVNLEKAMGTVVSQESRYIAVGDPSDASSKITLYHYDGNNQQYSMVPLKEGETPTQVKIQHIWQETPFNVIQLLTQPQSDVFAFASGHDTELYHYDHLRSTLTAVEDETQRHSFAFDCQSMDENTLLQEKDTLARWPRPGVLEEGIAKARQALIEVAHRMFAYHQYKASQSLDRTEPVVSTEADLVLAYPGVAKTASRNSIASMMRYASVFVATGGYGFYKSSVDPKTLSTEAIQEKLRHYNGYFLFNEAVFYFDQTTLACTPVTNEAECAVIRTSLSSKAENTLVLSTAAEYNALERSKGHNFLTHALRDFSQPLQVPGVLKVTADGKIIPFCHEGMNRSQMLYLLSELLCSDVTKQVQGADSGFNPWRTFVSLTANNYAECTNGVLLPLGAQGEWLHGCFNRVSNHMKAARELQFSFVRNQNPFNPFNGDVTAESLCATEVSRQMAREAFREILMQVVLEAHRGQPQTIPCFDRSPHLISVVLNDVVETYVRSLGLNAEAAPAVYQQIKANLTILCLNFPDDISRAGGLAEQEVVVQEVPDRPFDPQYPQKRECTREFIACRVHLDKLGSYGNMLYLDEALMAHANASYQHSIRHDEDISYKAKAPSTVPVQEVRDRRQLVRDMECVITKHCDYVQNECSSWAEGMKKHMQRGERFPAARIESMFSLLQAKVTLLKNREFLPLYCHTDNTAQVIKRAEQCIRHLHRQFVELTGSYVGDIRHRLADYISAKENETGGFKYQGFQGSQLQNRKANVALAKVLLAQLNNHGSLSQAFDQDLNALRKVNATFTLFANHGIRSDELNAIIKDAREWARKPAAQLVPPPTMTM